MLVRGRAKDQRQTELIKYNNVILIMKIVTSRGTSSDFVLLKKKSNEAQTRVINELLLNVELT